MQRRIGWLLATIIGIVAIIVVLVLYRSNEQPTRVRTMAEVNLKHNKQPFAKKGSDDDGKYEPTKKDLANKNFVQTGQIKKVGQYQITDNGLVQKWVDSKKVNQTITNGTLNYKIEQINVIKNTARTQNALVSARHTLNDRNISDKFTTLVINYRVTNNNAVTAITPGITAVKYPGSTTMSALSGIYNDGQLNTAGVVPYSTVVTTTTVLVPKKDVANLKSLNVQFATVKDSAGNKIEKPSAVNTITF